MVKLKSPFVGQNKTMTMSEAIKKYVNDGDVIYIGGFQIGIPTAACFEIARQKKRNLKAWTVGHDTCLGIDLLVETGCCNEVHFGWLASWPARRASGTMRKFKAGKVKIFHYSNLGGVSALMAAFLGLPFMPVLSEIGTDMEKYNPNIKSITCPFAGRKLGAIKAPEIDVAIVHVQRADPLGNGQRWMSRTVGDEWAGSAAKRTILTCEELVPNSLITHDPDRTIIPFFKTCAVVEVPWGAHPTGMWGYYIRDNPFETYAATCAMDEERFQKFVEEWVYGCDDRTEYIKHYVKKFGYEGLERLKIKHHIYPIAPVDYGYTSYEVTKGVTYEIEH